MQSRLSFYPNIRRDFGTASDVADVLNRSTQYVWKRINGEREFTYRERVLIARAVGKTAAEADDYCRKEA